MAPGLHPTLSNAEYHGGPGVSKSHLDVVARSPLHYWAAYLDPNRKPRVATPAMTLGSAVHSAILEPDLFPQEYVCVPEDAPSRPSSRQINAKKPSPDTVAAILYWQEFDEQHAGKTLLTSEQWAVALGCRDAALKHPVVRSRLSRGRAEESFFAVDPDTGELVKCRTDWRDGTYVLDVKTTEDASPEGFVRSVMTYRYCHQISWYQDVVNAALDIDEKLRWEFLAIEKKPPFALALYSVPAQAVSGARVETRRNLHDIVRCKLLDSFPGYPEEPTELQFPSWALRGLGVDSPEADFE